MPSLTVTIWIRKVTAVTCNFSTNYPPPPRLKPPHGLLPPPLFLERGGGGGFALILTSTNREANDAEIHHYAVVWKLFVRGHIGLVAPSYLKMTAQMKHANLFIVQKFLPRKQLH